MTHFSSCAHSTPEELSALVIRVMTTLPACELFDDGTWRKDTVWLFAVCALE